MAYTTDLGNQSLTYDYGQAATSQLFNKINYNLIPVGVYSGMLLTSNVGANTVSIAPGVVFYEDDTNDVGVRIETTTAVVLSVTGAAQPFIVARFEWVNTANNFLGFEQLAYSNIQAGDIILGRLEFNGATLLTSVDYNRKTKNIFDDITTDEAALRVYSTEATPDKNIVVSSGTVYTSKGLKSVSGGSYGPLSDTGGSTRTDLVYVDVDGVVNIAEGETEYNGRKVIAQITRLASRTDVRGSDITWIDNSNIGVSEKVYEDLTIVGGNLYIGTAAVLLEGPNVETDLTRNAYYDGSWKRRIADNHSILFEMDEDGKTKLYRNTDANATADSAITWGQSYIVDHNGQIYFGARVAGTANISGLNANTTSGCPVLTLETESTGSSNVPTIEFSKYSTTIPSGEEIGSLRWFAGTTPVQVAKITGLINGTSEDSADLVFYTASSSVLTEAMRINSAGRVTINKNSNTSAMLYILSDTSSLPALLLEQDNSSTTSDYYILTLRNKNATANNLSSILFDSESGSVGGNAAAIDCVYTERTPLTAKADLVFKTSNGNFVPSEVMRLLSSGLVGINESAPDGKFTVKGDGTAGSNLFTIKGSGVNHAMSSIAEVDTVGLFKLKTASNGGLEIDALSLSSSDPGLTLIGTSGSVTTSPAISFNTYFRSGTTRVAISSTDGTTAQLINFCAGTTAKATIFGDGRAAFDGGVITKNVGNAYGAGAPSGAELTAAFGITPSSSTNGFIGVTRNTSDASNWLVAITASSWKVVQLS